MVWWESVELFFCHCLWGMQLKCDIFPRHFQPPQAGVYIPASLQFLNVIQYTTNEVKKKNNIHLGTPMIKVVLGILLCKGYTVISVAFQWSTNVTLCKRQDELVDTALGFSPVLNLTTTEFCSLKSLPPERL